MSFDACSSKPCALRRGIDPAQMIGRYPGAYLHSVAATSIAPATAAPFLFVHRISTLCAHSMYLAQPGAGQSVPCSSFSLEDGEGMEKNLLQYANFLPRYLPAKGTSTMVKSS